jgi:hypothetical protein
VALLVPAPARANFFTSQLKSSLDYSAISAGAVVALLIVAVEGSATMEEFGKRTTGDPVLPSLRLDEGYQRVGNSAQGFSSKVQAGYAMLGADVEFLRYWQRRPAAATLDFGEAEGLVRLADRPSFKADFAYGYRETTGGRGLAPQLGASFGEYSEDGPGLEADLRWTRIQTATVLGDWRARFLWRFPGGPLSVWGGYRGLRLENGHRDGPEAGLTLTW